jgi:hypothetical protein
MDTALLGRPPLGLLVPLVLLVFSEGSVTTKSSKKCMVLQTINSQQLMGRQFSRFIASCSSETNCPLWNIPGIF